MDVSPAPARACDCSEPAARAPDTGLATKTAVPTPSRLIAVLRAIGLRQGRPRALASNEATSKPLGLGTAGRARHDGLSAQLCDRYASSWQFSILPAVLKYRRATRPSARPCSKSRSHQDQHPSVTPGSVALARTAPQHPDIPTATARQRLHPMWLDGAARLSHQPVALAFSP